MTTARNTRNVKTAGPTIASAFSSAELLAVARAVNRAIARIRTTQRERRTLSLAKAKLGQAYRWKAKNPPSR